MGNIIPHPVVVAGVKMPRYYIPNAVINEDDMKRIRNTWTIMIENRSQEYLIKKSKGQMDQDSCFAWFYTSFYDRLFQVYPQCRPMFKGDIQIQGRALVRMLTTCLQYMESSEAFSDALRQLAIRHVQRGVQSEDYFVVGEVLLWTFNLCFGGQFDEETKMAWIKVYSRMLQDIIPTTVDYCNGEGASTEVGVCPHQKAHTKAVDNSARSLISEDTIKSDEFCPITSVSSHSRNSSSI